MKAPAHIATGLTFTGVLCSIYDVNIFESYANMGICILCSLLPDIDTTRTLIGKSFYPIAKIINRHFGHRTITHSFLFLIFIFTLLKILFYFNLIQSSDLIMIGSFAVLSHIILDMFTLAGVPFLYPFLRNSCVIPGNPNYRFTVGDWKAELVVTGTCGILAFTMQPLFQNGFWTTYNRSFGTIKHVHRENNNTDKYTLCDYDYIDNNMTHHGTAIVIESQVNEITLFDQGEIFVLNTADPKIKVNYTRPRPSNIPKQYTDIKFFNITLDSLQRIMAGKLITGLIQSNHNIEYIDKAIKYNTNFINLKNKYNFIITVIADSVTSRNTELAELQATQAEELRRYRRLINEYNTYTEKVREHETALADPSLSNYERNKLQNELIHLRQHPKELPPFEPSLRTQVRIDELRKSLNERNLQFSGYLTVYQIVDPSLPEVRQQYREIDETFVAPAQQKRKSVF
jgi:inner membrane protein